ncbi:hypothetical protein SMU69_07660, partial [Streptococcus mutans NLML4]
NVEILPARAEVIPVTTTNQIQKSCFTYTYRLVMLDRLKLILLDRRKSNIYIKWMTIKVKY